MTVTYGALGRSLSTTLLLALGVSLAGAQVTTNSKFSFETFTVAGAVTLGVESVNDSGTISGYLVDASSNTMAFLRFPGGGIKTYVQPEDSTTPTFTQGGQINDAAVAAGEYYDTAAGTYRGYLYDVGAEVYHFFAVPGEPQHTTTGLAGVNDYGVLCGFVSPPPYTSTNAFIYNGTVTIFSVNGATSTTCAALNNTNEAVGYYLDVNGVNHGFLRTSTGTITTIDVPGASTTPGTAPCAGTVAGTVALGINNAGYVSGHYWDTSNNEHGFIRTPSGSYIQIDVPGAYQTSGGGINDHVELVGHYADSACNPSGYIATP